MVVFQDIIYFLYDLYSFYVLIIFSIAVLGSLYRLYLKISHNIKERLEEKRNRKDYKSEIPKELLTGIKEEETILYRSPRIKLRKQIHTAQFEIYIAFFGFSLFFYSSIYSLLSSTLNDFLLLSILIPIGFVFPLFPMFSIPRHHKKDLFLVLTDRNVHFYKLIYRDTFGNKRNRSVTSIYSYEKLLGFSVRKFLYDSRGDYGTIHLYTNEAIPKKVKIHNIPNFSQFRPILESLLYWFGNIPHNAPPLSLEISAQKRARAKLSQRRLLIYIFVSIGVAFLVIYFTLISMIEDYIKFIVNIATISVLVLFLIMLFIEIVVSMNRMKPLGSSLSIAENEIVFREDSQQKILKYCSTLAFSFSNSRRILSLPLKIEQNYDILKIYDFPKPKEEVIHFGPIENLPRIYSQIFSIYLKWKDKNNLLLSRDALLKGKIPLSPEMMDARTSDLRKKELLEEYIKDKIQKPISPAQLAELETEQKYLEPNDKIIATTKPVFQSKKATIELITGIACILLCISLVLFWYLPLPEFLLYLGLLPLTFIGIGAFTGAFFFTMGGLSKRSLNKRLKKSRYTLTPDKLLVVNKDQVISIRIESIRSVDQRIHQDHTYSITVFLNKPAPELPGILKSIVGLSSISLEDKFYHILHYLVEPQSQTLPEKVGMPTFMEYFQVIMPDFKKNVLPLIVLVLLVGLTIPLRYLIIDWRLYIIISLVIFSIYIYINRRLKKRSRSQPQNSGQEQVQGVQKPLHY